MDMIGLRQLVILPLVDKSLVNHWAKDDGMVRDSYDAVT